MAPTKAVTVKLPQDLYQAAADIVALTDCSFRELVAAALERELRDRRDRGGSGLKQTLDRMREFREQSATA